MPGCKARSPAAGQRAPSRAIGTGIGAGAVGVSTSYKMTKMETKQECWRRSSRCGRSTGRAGCRGRPASMGSPSTAAETSRTPSCLCPWRTMEPVGTINSARAKQLLLVPLSLPC